MKRMLALAIAVPLVLMAAVPPSTGKPSEVTWGSTPGVAGIDAVGFLAGTWRGTMGEDFVEEIWSAPHADSVMGSFRWIRANGTPLLYEMLLITKESDAVRLRLRHFTATLDVKDDKPMTLRLADAGSSRAVFTAEKDASTLDRIVYERKGDTLAIDVEFVQPTEPDSKPRNPLRFQLTRVR